MNQQRRAAQWVWTSLLLGILIALVMVSAAAAHSPAQTTGGAYATLSRLELNKFPQISGQMRAYQSDGSFAQSLETGQVTIIEGDQYLPVDALTLQTPGVQFVLAILGGSDLAFKNTEGLSRLDYLLQGMDRWEAEPGEANTDDLSLIVQGSTELLHQRNAAEWLSSVRNINEDTLRQTDPDLLILSRALAVAAAAPPTPGMGKALLLITPALRASGLTGLQSLASTARQEGVHINIWLVASQEYGGSILSNGLRLLAAETGGAFFIYSGIEEIPNIQEYLDPLRLIYDFSYTSAIRSSGVFTVAADIQSTDFSLRTPPLDFTMVVAAPNPIFVSLPVEITRTFTDGSLITASTGTPIRFEPDGQSVRILVEFPDAIQRSIRQSTLLVNGQPVAVNTSPPYDHFTWDLTPYIESGQVLVKAEVQDALGLRGSSAEFPVTITVTGPPAPPPIAVMLTPQGALALLLSAVALGAVVGLVLLISGRLQLIRNPLAGKERQVKQAAIETSPAPAAGKLGGRAASGSSTKPLGSARSAVSGLPGWMGRIQRRMQPTRTDAPVAYLTPITEGEDGAAPPLPINADESILGREITWTTWAIKDPSLAPVHARLRREGAGFRLFDEKTVGGTWVNYTPVPPQGILLAHGDAIHFGRVGFRFGLRRGSPQKPVVIPLKKKYPF